MQEFAEAWDIGNGIESLETGAKPIEIACGTKLEATILDGFDISDP